MELMKKPIYYRSFISRVNIYVYMKQIQVQLRVPQKTVEEIDRLVKKGRFASRSDAIKNMIASYEEKEKTREFASLLLRRSEASKRPELLIPLGD